MKTRMKILLISAISAIGVAAGAAGIAAATSDGVFHNAGWGKHRGAELVCSQGEERLEDLVAFARFRLDIRDDQMAEWDAFAEAVRTGGDELLTTCERLDALHEGDAPSRFAEVEMLMEKALNATRGIRGAFDPLYAALDEEQRATVERLTRHRHGRHGDHGADGRKG